MIEEDSRAASVSAAWSASVAAERRALAARGRRLRARLTVLRSLVDGVSGLRLGADGVEWLARQLAVFTAEWDNHAARVRRNAAWRRLDKAFRAHGAPAAGPAVRQ